MSMRSSMKIITLKPRNLKYAITGLKILVKTLGARLYPKGKQVTKHDSKHGGDYTPFWFSEGNVHILPLLHSSQRLFVQRNNVKHRRHFVFFRVSENTHSCGITGISRWPQKVRYQKQDFIGDTTDENTPTYTILLFSSTCFTRW